MLIKTDVNLPHKTVFSNRNWNQSLNVHLVEYIGWSKLCADIILATVGKSGHKTVFSNRNWNQSLNVHLVEYIGWSKLCADIILATLYIALCDHPLRIFYK